MRSISRTFKQLRVNKLEKCNPRPGFPDSCQPCKDCGGHRKFMEEEDEPPILPSVELREDGDIELREDGGYELRESWL